jgi:nucleotide-binding universal stress UspA family protein
VGVDGSEHSRWALKWAGQKAKHRDALLHIIHAHATAREDTPAWYEAGSSGLSPGEAIIDDAYALVATSHPSVVARAEVVGGPPVAALTRVSRSAELLVVGARGRGGFSELLVGSVSDQCIQYAHCPVVVVRTDPDEPPLHATGSRIVVGIDGSLGSTRALRWALAEAQVRSAPVLGVYAWQYPPIGTFVVDSRQGQELAVDEILHAATDYAAQWAPEVPFTAQARFGTTVPALLHESGEAELLVVGATGHGGFDGSLVGSVAHQCARHARCPVVVAHLQAEPDPAKGTKPGRARLGSNQP